jgi:hypothetical protein
MNLYIYIILIDIYLSIYLFIYLSIYLFILFIYLFIYYVFIYVFIWATVKTPVILNMYSTDIGLWKLMEIVKHEVSDGTFLN